MTRCSKHTSINTITKLTKFATVDRKLKMFTIFYGNVITWQLLDNAVHEVWNNSQIEV